MSRKSSEKFAGARRAALVVAFAAFLAGCEGGSLSGHSQSCSSTGGFFSDQTLMCSGTAERLGGSIGIEFGDDDDFGGEYRLEARISVEQGEAEVNVPGADGVFSAGRVSAGEPLTINEVVQLSEDDDVFSLDAGEGGEVRGLQYEGTVTPL